MTVCTHDGLAGGGGYFWLSQICSQKKLPLVKEV